MGVPCSRIAPEASRGAEEINMKIPMKIVVLILLSWSGAGALAAQQDYFSTWPTGSSPQEVGKKLVEHFVPSAHQYGPTIHYSEAATWYGALTFAQVTHDAALRAELIKRTNR
jgi:hypothetical protein